MINTLFLLIFQEEGGGKLKLLDKVLVVFYNNLWIVDFILGLGWHTFGSFFEWSSCFDLTFLFGLGCLWLVFLNFSYYFTF